MVQIRVIHWTATLYLSKKDVKMTRLPLSPQDLDGTVAFYQAVGAAGGEAVVVGAVRGVSVEWVPEIGVFADVLDVVDGSAEAVVDP